MAGQQESVTQCVRSNQRELALLLLILGLVIGLGWMTRSVLAANPAQNGPTTLIASPSSSFSLNNTITATITSTSTLTATPTLTATLSATATQTPTLMPTPTSTPTSSPTLIQTPISYLPALLVDRTTPTPQPVNLITTLYCDGLSNPLSIPDNHPAGITDRIFIDSPGIIADINVYVNIHHTWVGDLSMSIENTQNGLSVPLLDRPGVPASSLGCRNDSVIAIFDDQALQPAENKCASSPAAISGIFKPTIPLEPLVGKPLSGEWVLWVSDNYTGDTGSLRRWCLEVTTGNTLPPPTPTPTPVALPASALISGISGKNQALPLDCESRSAVDWAAYFGVRIDEFEFFDQLPRSDNPDKGFVGNVYGTWGQVPPNDYGVHAHPVAEVLRSYGLTARASHSTQWEEVKAEIAAGRPVIAWVIGSVTYGAPQYYTAASDNHLTVVARYQHTVIVTGYTQDSVTILDGASIYTRSLDRFLDSWSALRNQAIIARP